MIIVLYCLYLYDNLIRSKIIKDNQVLEGKTADPVKSKFETDIVKEKDTRNSKLNYWYSEHFFASGIQKVRNSLTGNENTGIGKCFLLTN
jgi:hypothetical protein